MPVVSAAKKPEPAPVRAAGVLHVTPAGHALFLKRSATSDHAGEWCTPGGGIEEGEDAEDAARRESAEEIGMIPGQLHPLARELSPEGVDFTTFRHQVPTPFAPTLNDEHDEFTWAPIDAPPDPLHPGVKSVLAKMAMDAGADQRDRFALDEGSVRKYDRDGRLHVALSNISKAAVNQYMGKEIPAYAELGLDPGKIYKLFRDPAELAKAAPTFNNLPLLSKHVPVTSVDHKPELVIGSTGTDAEFSQPFLRNSLVLWTQDAIEAVESERQKELSSAYRYRADMTPGEFEGEAYDGVMRDIVGNHVALVKEGRAGSDVVVGDSNQEIRMASKNIILTRKAALLAGGLYAAITPILAQDASIDLAPMLKDITAKNFDAKRKAKLIIDLAKGLKGKMAQDASLEDVNGLLDRLGNAKIQEGVDEDPESGLPMEELPAPVAEEPAADPMIAKIKAMLAAAGVDDAIIAKIDAVASEEDPVDPADGGATDEPPAFKGMPKVGGAKDKKAMDKAAKDAVAAEVKEKTKDLVSKPAMDAAIKAAVELTVKSQQELRDAEKAVRPYVGEITIAADSAAGIYRAALTALGVKGADDIHESALRTILEMQPIPGARPARKEPLAQDAAAAKTFGDRNPDTARIRFA